MDSTVTAEDTTFDHDSMLAVSEKQHIEVRDENTHTVQEPFPMLLPNLDLILLHTAVSNFQRPLSFLVEKMDFPDSIGGMSYIIERWMKRRWRYW